MNGHFCYKNDLRQQLEALVIKDEFSSTQTRMLLELIYDIVKEYEFARIQSNSYLLSQDKEKHYFFLQGGEYKQYDNLLDYINSVFSDSFFANEVKLIMRYHFYGNIVDEMLRTAQDALHQCVQDSL